MWIDVRETGLKGDEFASLLRQKTGLWLCGGSQYGKGGENFVRLNLATSFDNIKDACLRLKAI